MKFKSYISAISVGVGLGVLVSGTVAFAGGVEAAPQAHYFGSFYVGAGVDYSTFYGKSTTRADTYVPELGFNNASFYNPVGTAAYYGNVLLGYETPSWHRFNLAFEAFLTAAPTLSSQGTSRLQIDPFRLGDRNYTTSGEYQIDPTYGIALMPGFRIQPNLTAFARVAYLGGSLTDEKRSVDILDGRNTVGQTDLLNTYHIRRRYHLDGVQAGLGFRLRASKHIVYSTGYYWSDLNSTDNNFITSDPENELTLIQQSRNKNYIETFSQSILYYFTPFGDYYAGDRTFSGGEIYGGLFADRDVTSYGENEHLSNPCVQAVCTNTTPPGSRYYSAFGAEGTGSLVMPGWGYEAFLGYGYTFANHLYMGSEFFYNVTNSSTRLGAVETIPSNVSAGSAGSTTNYNVNFKFRNSWGVAFLPGYRLNNHLVIFSELGFVTRNLLQQYRFTTSIVDPRGLALFNRRVNVDLYGYQIGAGFDVLLTHNLYLRNEYVLSTYGSLHVPRVWACCSASGGGYGVGYDTTVYLTSSMYKLGLEYRLPV